MKTHHIILFAILLIASIACNPSPTASAQPTQAAPNVPAPTRPAQPPGLKPGANITPPAMPNAVAKNFTVRNPTTNTELQVYVYLPSADGKKFPAVALVPGGNGDGQGLTREAMEFARAGFVAIAFDPDGRGKSGGAEDYAGFKHQDGLAAVIRFAATLPQVDAKQIGIVTYSYGITMGSGALARYPDLPVKFLIDWEGPADRNDTAGCDGSRGGHLNRVANCADEKFWSEHEAVTFIAKIRVPYQRVQSEKDHVQPDTSHAILMINAAIKGGALWVRLNDYPANQTYDPKSPPQMFPESQDRLRDATIIKYAQALLNK